MNRRHSLNDLKVQKVDLNTKVDTNDEKIQMLTNDILAKNNFIEDMTEKLQEKIRERDNTKYKLNCATKDIDKLKSQIDLIEGNNSKIIFIQEAVLIFYHIDKLNNKENEVMKLQKDIEISKTLLDQSRTLHRSKINEFDQLKKQFEKNELTIIGDTMRLFQRKMIE